MVSYSLRFTHDLMTRDIVVFYLQIVTDIVAAGVVTFAALGRALSYYETKQQLRALSTPGRPR